RGGGAGGRGVGGWGGGGGPRGVRGPPAALRSPPPGHRGFSPPSPLPAARRPDVTASLRVRALPDVAAARAHLHIGPAKIRGVSWRCRTCRCCQIIIDSSTGPMPPGGAAYALGMSTNRGRGGEKGSCSDGCAEERLSGGP